MKKELVEALTTKFQGVSSSIIDRIATKLSKTVTTAEEVKTAVDGVTIQQIIESYADSRVTEAATTAREKAVKDYEAKYGLKDGKQISGGVPKKETTTEQNGAQDDTPAWAKALIENVGALTKDVDTLKATKTTNDRQQQLNAVIGELPEPLRKAYGRMSFDKCSDDEFSQLLADVSDEVKGYKDNEQIRGGIFGQPTVRNGNTSKELTKEQIAAISHREGVPADNEQPF